MNSIKIIGTIPPCPRCGLLTDIITIKVERLGIEAKIDHIAYTSEEAKKIAKSFGLIPGTAKDVAQKLGEEIDISTLPHHKKADLKENELPPEFREYAKEFAKVAILDDRLRPYEDMAQKMGFLMTPVLIINEQIKHQGSVPKLSCIDEWLSALK